VQCPVSLQSMFVGPSETHVDSELRFIPLELPQISPKRAVVSEFSSPQVGWLLAQVPLIYQEVTFFQMIIIASLSLSGGCKGGTQPHASSASRYTLQTALCLFAVSVKVKCGKIQNVSRSNLTLLIF